MAREDDMAKGLAARRIDIFCPDLGLPDRPVLRDDIGQYSMDKEYAVLLRRLRSKRKSSSIDSKK